MFSKTPVRSCLPLAAALAMTTIASPVDGRSARSITVAGNLQVVTRYATYTDLDLGSTVDRRILHGRVDFAVNEACSAAIGPRDRVDFWECTANAWRGARPQIERAVKHAGEASTGIDSVAAVAIIVDARR